MFRVLTATFVVALSGCQCGQVTGPDAGSDAGSDAGADAGADGGGVADGGDGGPVCSPEICDGLDNDCDGTVDLFPDAGPLTQLCPLQLGPCRGAKVSCEGGTFASCVAAYGAKYEEFESLCDGVDNDCSGVADVSQWRPVGEVAAAGAAPLAAVSVPSGWYVTSGLNAQMFDEQLRPTSDLFLIGRGGAADLVSSSASAFGGYLNQLLVQLPVPGAIYVRRLNLDGTYPTTLTGAPLELELAAGHTVPLTPGALQVSNDQSTMLVAFTQSGSVQSQQLLTLWPDGGTRAPLAEVGDAGQWRFQSAPVGTEDFVVALSYPSRLQLQRYSPDLIAQGSPVELATPAQSLACAVSTQTWALDAGAQSVLAICPDQRQLYAAEDPFGGATLTSFWETDAGTISNVRVLPSYARASVFWIQARAGGASTVWMGQVNGQPVSIAQLLPQPAQVEVFAALRGGYLLEAVFDGGQGVRAYGAYVCPL